MTGDELAARLAEGGVTLVDVRTRPEFEGTSGYPCDPRQGHIDGAVHIELDALMGAGREGLRDVLAEAGVDADGPIVLYCHSGSRSGIAAAALRSAGMDAENYEGSWHEWSRRKGG
jgi:thiosulfate/3-mercaptopyruvate sulfurtransferase